ncbi:uncharacterized protein JCM6883_007225 [Sporobolomyces salmoneus]|uniref:uncharacterized protein n=1 Tax=Sporobolomyces salmoneus TaxID=183962 RepID=UPI00317D0FCC
MGKFIITMWARLLALTSASYVLWATLWAFCYRKFLWDFVGGDLGSKGLIPSPKVELFIKEIVDFPVVQIINLLLSLFTLSIEYPLHSSLLRLKLFRSLPVRVALHFVDFGFAMLLYQTIDGGVFYLVTSLVYFVAWRKGETIGLDGEGRLAETIKHEDKNRPGAARVQRI